MGPAHHYRRRKFRCAASGRPAVAGSRLALQFSEELSRKFRRLQCLRSTKHIIGQAFSHLSDQFLGGYVLYSRSNKIDLSLFAFAVFCSLAI